MEKNKTLSKYAYSYDRSKFKTLNEEMSYAEYIDLLSRKPKLARNAFQYMYDMIVRKGTRQFERYRKTYTHYNFFDDPTIPIYGLEETLDQFVNFISGAAGHYGTQNRVLLLHGPVGSSKSTICRLLKKGLQEYSQEDDGAWFTYKWVDLPCEGIDAVNTSPIDACPMNEDPLKLMPMEMRESVLKDLNHKLLESVSESDRNSVYEMVSQGELCPRCQKYMDLLLAKYDGDWEQVVNKHIRVYRRCHSETRRVGIGTFQPKDEKNQDSTELTGDLNFGKIGEFGSDSDARCVALDTTIATANGFCHIGDFVHSGMETDKFYDVSEKTHTTSGVGSIVKVFNGGMDDCISIKTKLGYSLSCTKDHKLYVLKPSGERVWIKVQEISIGDYVALYKNVSTFSDKNINFPTWSYQYYGNESIDFMPPQVMTEDLAYLTGLWLGDGHFCNMNYEFGYTQMEPDRREKFRELTKKLFNVHLHDTKRGDTIRGLRTNCRQLHQWTQGILGLKAGANAKEIPNTILKSSKEVILACLRGLFETDGNLGNYTSSNVSSFVSMSHTLAKQVHTLLLAFGVLSSLRKTDDWYTVLVCGKHVNKLCKLIPELKERYTTGEERDILQYSSSVDGIPFVRNLLKELYKNADNRNELKKRFSGNLHDSRKVLMNRATVEDFINQVETSEHDIVENIQEILNEDVFWLPVVSKKEIGKQLVADLSVAEIHNYWANGFVVHNCFNFDGEFCVANRGVIEFIEMLKLSREFLYDLLGVTQEHNIKPKKFAQVSVDEVVIGHCNTPDFERLTGDRHMEALRDRTVKIDVPYLLRHSEEIKVYDHTYGPGKVKQHIMPHTLEIAAFFAILTRLRDDKETKLDLRDKAKLYDGQALPGWTEDSVKELRDKYPDEGLKDGVSARFIQDKISNCLARKKDYVNVFEVLNEIKLGLYNSSLIDVEHVKKYEECLDLAIKELQEILKGEVQRAMVGDGDLIVRLCAKYIDNVVAYVNEEKVQNPITKQDQEPDERLMRSIEEKIDIPEQGANDFRRSLAAFIGTLHTRKKEFRWDSNPELKRALEAKLFEDTRHTIKLSSLSSEASICDPELQEKIDAIKTRLVKQYGYNWQSATDILDYVSSIFSSGPTAK